MHPAKYAFLGAESDAGERNEQDRFVDSSRRNARQNPVEVVLHRLLEYLLYKRFAAKRHTKCAECSCIYVNNNV